MAENHGVIVVEFNGNNRPYSIKIEKNRINVIIPFNKINPVILEVNNKVYNKVDNKKLNKPQLKIIEMIRDNPNITISQMMINAGLSYPGIAKNLKVLKDLNIIE